MDREEEGGWEVVLGAGVGGASSAYRKSEHRGKWRPFARSDQGGSVICSIRPRDDAYNTAMRYTMIHDLTPSR